MRLNFGRLPLEPMPAAKLPGYEAIVAADFKSLRMGFQTLSHWSCKTGKWTPDLPSALTLEPILAFSAPTALGKPNRAAQKARAIRMIKAMGFTGKQLNKTILTFFPPARFKVPVAKIKQLESPERSVLSGFYRDDMLVALVPPGRNPNSDFAILSLPRNIWFYAVQTDTCPSGQGGGDLHNLLRQTLIGEGDRFGLTAGPSPRVESYFTPKRRSLWSLVERQFLMQSPFTDYGGYARDKHRVNARPAELTSLIKAYKGK